MKFSFCMLFLASVVSPCLTHAVPSAAKNVKEFYCSENMAPGLTYEKLENWIKRCKPTTVADIVANLPYSFKANATFVYKSDAFAEVQHPGTVTPLYPRVILFGNKNFVITFTGKPGTPSYQRLETLEYIPSKLKVSSLLERPEAGRFNFQTISLDQRGSAKFDRHPTACLECHGSKVSHPIWHAYDRWPGVYGSNDDNMSLINAHKIVTDRPSLRREIDLFQNFTRHFSSRSEIKKLAPFDKDYREGDGRYEALDAARPLGDRYLNDHTLDGTYVVKTRPNLKLTNILALMYSNYLAGKIAEDARFWPAFNSIAWSGLFCDLYIRSDPNLLSYLKLNGIDLSDENIFALNHETRADYWSLQLYHSVIEALVPNSRPIFDVGGTSIGNLVAVWVINALVSRGLKEDYRIGDYFLNRAEDNRIFSWNTEEPPYAKMNFYRFYQPEVEPTDDRVRICESLWKKISPIHY